MIFYLRSTLWEHCFQLLVFCDVGSSQCSLLNKDIPYGDRIPFGKLRFVGDSLSLVEAQGIHFLLVRLTRIGFFSFLSFFFSLFHLPFTKDFVDRRNLQVLLTGRCPSWNGSFFPRILSKKKVKQTTSKPGGKGTNFETIIM